MNLHEAQLKSVQEHNNVTETSNGINGFLNLIKRLSEENLTVIKFKQE